MQDAVQSQGEMNRGSDDEEIDLRQFAGVLWAGRWTVVLIAASIILLGAFFIFLMPPVFQADGSVQVEQESSKSGSSSPPDLSTLLNSGNAEADAEIQILQSRMILSQVAQQLNLEISATPHYFPVIGAAIARRYKKGGVAGAWLGLDRYAWGGEHIVLTTLNVPPELLNTPLSLKVTAAGYSIFDGVGEKLLDGVVGEPAVAAFASGKLETFVRELQGRVGEEFSISRIPVKYVLDGLQQSLSVAELGKQSGVIQLIFTGDNAAFVTKALEEIQKAYVRQNVERRSAEAKQSLEFLKEQLPDARGKMSAAQTRLNAYQEKRGSVDVSAETQGVLSQSVGLDTKRLELDQTRQEALQRFTPQHPSVLAIDEELHLLDEQAGKIKGQISKLPQTQQEILSLTNDVQVSTQLYTDMLNSIQQLQVAQAGTIGNVRVIDPPLQPLQPTKPKRALLLGAVIVMSVILACGFVLLRHLLRHGVEDPLEVEREFGVATYATIPFANEQPKLWQLFNRGGEQRPLLAVHSPAVAAVEAFRSLRTSLHFAMLEAQNNIVMLTGPSPGLGKTFVTVNLGVVLAQAGKRVLTIDADLRRGLLHEYFGKKSGLGLSDCIAGDIALDQAVEQTEVKGLSIISRGTSPPNPSELLLSERFSEILKTVSKQFDYVLIDTPPILAVTDAALIGAHAGTSFVVLKAGAHPLREIGEVLRRLKRGGVVVKGTVFNQAAASGGYYGYGRYAYEYHAYNSKS